MRVIPTVIILFLLMIVGSLTSYHYINSTSTNLVTHLEKVEAALDVHKWSIAQEELKLTETSWDTKKYWWTILLDHHEIDNIDFSVQRLNQYIKAQNTALSLGEISTLKMLFEHIADTEALTLKNIL